MAGIIKRPPQRAEARREADALLAKSRTAAAAEAKAERARAYEIGLAEGREAGRQQALLEAREEACKAAAARLGEVELAIVTLIQELEQRKHGLLADAERDLLALAFALAARICKREFEARPGESAAANLAAAIRQIGAGSRVVVHLHPDDLGEVQSLLPSLVAASEHLQHMVFCAADDVSRGGCRIVVPHGSIDTQLDTQLEAMAVAVLGEHAPQQIAKIAQGAAVKPSAFVPAAPELPVSAETVQ